ncbi:DgyrCDS9282 [Dimorphilus gyrociliatus]|uniref:DgyrCDS9282 n=1 Tax=Dimorphilus gyrociliatus TaxID=2664684 RepID=A0A7I8VWW1_9ANNE|nr:DgyrCDS9282 [Dimorphilus gyrociliatus]
MASLELTAQELGITDKQWNILAKFKEVIKDEIRPTHTDYYLVKWLKARNYDISKAESMFRNSMKWRDEFGTDSLLTEFKDPEVLEKHWTGGTTGFDTDGRPLFLMACRGMDFKGIFRSVNKSDLHKFHIKRMMRLLEIGKEQTAKTGKQIDQTTVVADMDGLTLKQFFVPGMDQMYEVLRIYESNFPEFLGAAYVINGDWKSKVLGKFIEADQLPVSWGGTQIDENGDEFCKTKVIYGTEVPKSYFLKDKGLLNEKNTVKINVKRGSAKRIEFNVDEENSALKYAFQTDNHDVGFGIFKAKNPKDSVKDMQPLIQPKRLNCHLVPESGSIRLQEKGLYLVIFDNSYSWARSKTVYYDIEILKPDKTSDMKVEELKEGEEEEEEIDENWKTQLEDKLTDNERC